MSEPETKLSEPIKIRWANDSAALNKFLTREIEPLEGTPEEQRDITRGELETIREVVCGRQKTNIVIQTEQERELVLNQLKRFANGIGHPEYGGMWASKSTNRPVQRIINELETVGEVDD